MPSNSRWTIYITCILSLAGGVVMALQENPPIVDSRLSRDAALRASFIPKTILDSQEVVDVQYLGFDAKRHIGQIVVNRTLAADVRAIFHDIDSSGFALQSVIPIVHFAWLDDASIAANNTSAFNYRFVAGTSRLSMHAFGRAIDINPYLNPWVGRKGTSLRPYNTTVAGTIKDGDVVVRAFTRRGWKWGGNWANSKDYQHFEKR